MMADSVFIISIMKDAWKSGLKVMVWKLLSFHSKLIAFFFCILFFSQKKSYKVKKFQKR